MPKLKKFKAADLQFFDMRDLDTADFDLAKHMAFKLRYWRTIRGKSQADLAQAIGSHRPLISRMESGEIVPKLDSILRVCQALNLNLSHFDFPEKKVGE